MTRTWPTLFLALVWSALGLVAAQDERMLPASPAQPWTWFAVGGAIVIALGWELHRRRSRTPRDRSPEAVLRMIADRSRASLLQDIRDLRRDTRLPVLWRHVHPNPGPGGDIADLVEAQVAARSGQLVILGPPGSGKTTAAQLLVLDLLERSAGETVPVVFSFSGWRESTPVVENLVERLTSILPEPVDRAVLRDLVQSGRVLPVLDGVDEAEPQLRHGFLTAVFRSGLPVVLTSRYDSFVARSARTSESTVVELLPLDPRDAVRRLVSEDPRWRPVVEAVESNPRHPIASLLRSPMHVSMMARVYAAPDRSPTELLDRHWRVMRAVLYSHFLEDALRLPESLGYGRVDLRDRMRWLGFLAHRGGGGIAWWELSTSVPRTVFQAAAVVIGVVVGAAGVSVSGGSLRAGAFLGVSAILVTAYGSFGHGPLTRPFPYRISLANRWSLALFGAGAGLGLVSGTVALVRGGPVTAAVTWLVVCLAAGTIPALLAALARPIRGDIVHGARGALIRDRRMALAQGATTALITGFVAAFAGMRGVPGLVAFGLSCGLVGVTHSAWFRYSLSRSWLALRGRLPWNLLAFLEEQHQAGLLVRSGGSYRFFHRSVEEYVTAEYLKPPPEVDERAFRVAASLVPELVEAAFDRADVRAVIVAPRVRTLKKEILTEVRDSLPDLVVAAESGWERYVAAKQRMLTAAGVPRAARWSRVFAYTALVAAVVGVCAHLSVTASPTVIAVTMSAVLVLALVAACGTALLVLGEFEHVVWPVLDDDTEDEQSPRRRKTDRLRDLAIAFRRSRFAPRYPAFFVGCVSAEMVITVGVFYPAALRSAYPRLMVAAGVLALVFLPLWRWSRPRKALWNALSGDDPSSWPSEQDLPHPAAYARRDAVRAHADLVDALVDNGVLPKVAARMEVLARRDHGTTLPDASVKRLGDLTDRSQFVPTDTSARLNRMLDAMSGGAIGLSGPRGIGKSTVLGIFGDRRFGGNPDDLTVVVSAPTNYQSRDFLVHLFAKVCRQVLPTDEREAPTGRRWSRVRWAVTAVVGVLLAVGAALWPVVLRAAKWVGGNPRIAVIGAGALLVAFVVVEVLVRRRSRRRRAETSVEAVARRHLRMLRYLETTTRTATTGLKPSVVELGGSHARQRAEQVRTYPELVSEFQDFLAFLVSRLPSRPDRPAPRVVVCIDEVDKIATAEGAELFLNDVKTIFGVPGCFFLVALSEDALASFSRRALTMRTTFDSAFDTVIQVGRLTLPQTRRLLVQRVLRLPEPFVWFCHALSGGLPRDLNRIVRQLYDVRAAQGVDQLDELVVELVREDLHAAAQGHLLQVGRAPEAGVLLRWIARTTRLPLEHDALMAHRKDAPQIEVGQVPGESAELWLVRERFQAYLYYAAALLKSFGEQPTEVVEFLSTVDDDATNPVRLLAEARAQLVLDSALATAAVDAYRAAVPAMPEA